MAESQRFLRPIISLLLVGASVLGLINVYSDNSEVLAQAKRVACGDKECPTQLTELNKTPLSHTYTLVAEEAKHRNVTHIVKCQRAQFLFGDWRCTDLR